MLREFFKVGHLFFVIVWVGSLLLLSYLMSLRDISLSLVKRLYVRFDFPAMLLAIFFGILLLLTKLTLFKQPYFHLKLTLVFLLIVVDLFFCTLLWKKKERKSLYKGIHILTIALLIAIFFTIYVGKVLLSL